MNSFIFTGIITSVDTRQFQNGSFSKTLHIEEKRDSENTDPNKIKVDFNGYYAKEVPNADLRGVEVAIIAKIIGTPSQKGFIIHNIRGTQLKILSFPRFEEDIPELPHQSIPEPESTVQITDDDLPF